MECTKSLRLSKEDMEIAFERAGIDPKRRGETLSLARIWKTFRLHI